MPPTPTLADHKTVFTDSQGLESLYQPVLDIRAWLVPVVNPTTSLQFVPDMGILIGGTVYTALEAIEAAVEDFEGRLGVVEGGLAQAISDAADALRVAESAMSSLDIFKGQLDPKVETLRRDMIYAEERIRSLEERHNTLAQRVGVLESGTYTQ